MSSHKRIAAVALAILLVLSVIGPALAVAQTDGKTETTDDGPLSFDVENGDNDTLVITVSDDNGTVEGATVTVDTVDDDAEVNETSEVYETSEANETTDDATYQGTGTYETDGNGTVTVPAPEETVELVITVEDGDRTTTSEVRANPGVGVPFGQQVQAFVQELLSSDSNESIGQQVSEFVRANNPGNAPDDAGPPEDRGSDDNGSERGPPEDRGSAENGSERGPPEDRGSAENGSERGPPEDRGSDDNESEREPPEDDEDEEGSPGNGSGGPPADDGTDDEEETTETESG
jgi:hypothetical protein